MLNFADAKVCKIFFSDNVVSMQSLYAIALAVILVIFILNKKESYGNTYASASAKKKKICRTNASKSLWNKYDWTQRIQGSNGKWVCPDGWKDTGCNWGMGKEFENKQCNRLKTVLDPNDVCNTGVNVFSEANFTSIDKYPTQIITCDGNATVLPAPDGKPGYSSIIVPDGLTATVTFNKRTWIKKFLFNKLVATGETFTQDFVGPIQTAFNPYQNDQAVSVSITRTR